MNSQIAVVGNLDVILIFKSIGCDVFEVRDNITAIKTLNSLLENYKLILVTDDFAPFIEDIVKETSKNMFPIITIIPSGMNDSNYALNSIEKSVEHTLGINILAKEQDKWKDE